MSRLRSLKFALIVLILLVGGGASAPEEGFPVKALPREGKSLRDFLPRGWIVQEQVKGDLDGDGGSDIAAVLVEEKPDSDEDGAKNERQRGLIVLLGRDDEKYILGGTNNKLLQCTTCGGVKEGVAVEIKKGVIIVSQSSGSREFADDTWRFRYDPPTRRFVLIGRDIENGDSALGTGKVESFNFLTGLKITETYRYDKEGKRKITISTKREKGPKNTPFIEDVETEY